MSRQASRCAVILWAGCAFWWPAAAGSDPPEAGVISTGWVTPTILAVTVDEGKVLHRPLTDYQPQPQDEYVVAGPEIPPRLRKAAHVNRWPDGRPTEGKADRSFWFVRRAGVPLGWVVGPERMHLWPVQEWLGVKVRLDNAKPEQFSLRATGTGAAGRHPTRVTRKTRPHAKGATGPGYEGPLGRRHTILLDWGSGPPSAGDYELVVQLPGLFSSLPVRVDDRRERSEAVQVNLAGYQVGSSVKRGFYSFWLGEWGGVTFAPVEFEVQDAASGEVVFNGRPRRRTASDGTEWVDAAGRSYAQAGGAVWELDFSAWDRPGTYVLRVPGVGISAEFEIRPRVWHDAFRLQMLGLLHQRSGIALGPPFTDYRRPRNLHPADGQEVLSCDEQAFWAHVLAPGETEANPFARIAASVRPGTHNPSAWGSWADAADHDRRYVHLEAVHVLLMLWELNPDHFGRLRLDLPPGEEDNGLPDIFDEARWGLDLYRRMQREDGAIIYGIESLHHPNRGEPSWLETLPVAVVPPTPDAAFAYAGAAARFGRMLAGFDPVEAAEWQESARRAQAWATATDGDPRYPPRYRSRPENRMMAAWQLIQAGATGGYVEALRREVEEVTANWDRTPPGSRPLFQNLFPVIELVLAREVPPELLEARTKWRGALISTAEELLRGAEESAYGLLRKPGQGYFYWIVEAEGGAVLAAAHRLTGDPRYLAALEGAAHFAMGANPLNLAYTSGLGARSIRPMVGDAEFAQRGYPQGIPAYGPAVIPRDGLPPRAWGWDERRARALQGDLWPPDLTVWPLYETYFESIALPVINEFTLHQGVCDQLLRWGFLAQHYGSTRADSPRPAGQSRGGSYE